MYKTLKIVLLLLILGFEIAILGALAAPKQKFGDVGTGARFTSMTVSVAALSNASSVVLTKSSGRQYARFQNDDASINVWLCLASTCTASTGIKLTPGSSYEINGNNMYVGDVSAIAASGTPNLDLTTNP